MPGNGRRERCGAAPTTASFTEPVLSQLATAVAYSRGPTLKVESLATKEMQKLHDLDFDDKTRNSFRGFISFIVHPFGTVQSRDPSF